MELIKAWTKEKFGAEKWPHMDSWRFYYVTYPGRLNCACCCDDIERGTQIVEIYESKTMYINNLYRFCQDCGEKLAEWHGIEIKPY